VAGSLVCSTAVRNASFDFVLLRISMPVGKSRPIYLPQVRTSSLAPVPCPRNRGHAARGVDLSTSILLRADGANERGAKAHGAWEICGMRAAELSATPLGYSQAGE
jgi:hypothetical protein